MSIITKLERHIGRTKTTLNGLLTVPQPMKL